MSYALIADLEPFLGGALDNERAQRALDAATEHIDAVCGQTFTDPVPASIEQACVQVAVRYYRDPEAPFGVIQAATEGASYTKNAIPDLDHLLIGHRVSWGVA